MVFKWCFDKTTATLELNTHSIYIERIQYTRWHLEASVLNLSPFAMTLTLQREHTQGI